ncbi:MULTISPECIES: S8 family serine peptidase [Kitasatospora]|uniref:Putative peptidase S08 family protein n=1 Tax=Kitasatospora setae (strain ATCC 33774 / DSM 43861 / JCM 3304 / KCC A-0304 / NBRC 14216 / KM-6054) TaxID=452652 RepID=E4N0B6_KITSK|nr:MULTISPECIES: S8 family serine peptidase [Kitasatospora]BAJ31444.1 putative peptidase S08 family protein [Kitasatospora setae KM-6054]
MSVPRIRRSALTAACLVLATAGALALPATAANAAPADGPLLSYVVNTKANHGQTQKAEREIRAAGGTVVASYERIGVVIAHSADPGFAATLRASKAIDSVGASRTAGILAADVEDTVQEAAVPAAVPADGSEPLWANQWDMRQIGVDRAHRTTLGSRSVVVGVLDAGVDATHEDLAANVDPALSASCLGGSPDTSWQSWQPTSSDHGTHVAGTIAAAKNGKGIEGIAPGVRLAAVKVVDDGGFIYPEYAICGFVWAAEHHFQVTNNSYYVDPWMFNCADDPDQAAISEAVRRAVDYSRRNGVLNVAAAGNENIDLAHKTVDVSSPDDTTPVERPINENCLDLPAELPGVVAVSSVGFKGDKSYYSSYGLNKVAVAAPGGDARYQLPDTPDRNGRVLSTVRGNKYAYMQGTSMAAPHAAGVAALLASTHPWAGPDQLRALLLKQADAHACPTGVYNPGGTGAFTATCEGPDANNGFYGTGVVSAAKAADWWRN